MKKKLTCLVLTLVLCLTALMPAALAGSAMKFCMSTQNGRYMSAW